MHQREPCGARAAAAAVEAATETEPVAAVAELWEPARGVTRAPLAPMVEIRVGASPAPKTVPSGGLGVMRLPTRRLGRLFSVVDLERARARQRRLPEERLYSDAAEEAPAVMPPALAREAQPYPRAQMGELLAVTSQSRAVAVALVRPAPLTAPVLMGRPALLG